MNEPTVMVCFGTRPEVIKMAPVVAALRDGDAPLRAMPVSTGQHRHMLDQALEAFGLVPAADLSIMRPSQSLSDLTARLMEHLGALLEEHAPDALLVQGDTTTAFCGALAAFYAGIPVGHVEAGLRTHDPRRPFPEEINRRLISSLARWHFCATPQAAANLDREGVDPAAVEVTGNTVIDALTTIAARPLDEARQRLLPPRTAARRILVTLHRRETHGEAQRRLCRMLGEIASREDVDVLFPVHLSPAVRASVDAELAGHPSVHLVEPLDYESFVHALRDSHLVVSDSGGVQEEAPTFGVPVLVMRDTTERPEGVAAGCSVLCGTEAEAVRAQILRLLDEPESYAAMTGIPNPYGDGHAAERIVSRLARDLVPEPEPEPVSAA